MRHYLANIIVDFIIEGKQEERRVIRRWQPLPSVVRQRDATVGERPELSPPTLWALLAPPLAKLKPQGKVSLVGAGGQPPGPEQ